MRVQNLAEFSYGNFTGGPYDYQSEYNSFAPGHFRLLISNYYGTLFNLNKVFSQSKYSNRYEFFSTHYPPKMLFLRLFMYDLNFITSDLW